MLNEMDAGPGRNRRIGRRGEAEAWRYLEDRGWALLDSNWHCRYRELDLICCDPDEEIVFVEVKYRTDTLHGLGTDAVGRQKLSRMRMAAARWLEHTAAQRAVEAHDRGDSFQVVRFDVIDVGPDGVREHIEGVE